MVSLLPVSLQLPASSRRPGMPAPPQCPHLPSAVPEASAGPPIAALPLRCPHPLGSGQILALPSFPHGPERRGQRKQLPLPSLVPPHWSWVQVEGSSGEAQPARPPFCGLTASGTWSKPCLPRAGRPRTTSQGWRLPTLRVAGSCRRAWALPSLSLIPHPYPHHPANTGGVRRPECACPLSVRRGHDAHPWRARAARLARPFTRPPQT